MRKRAGYMRMSHTPNYTAPKLTMEKAVADAKTDGYRDADDMADDMEPLNAKCYASVKAYTKTMDTSPDIAEAALTAYREGVDRFRREYPEFF